MSLESQRVFQNLLLFSSFIKIISLIHLFCYITNHLMTGSLGNSEFCFPQSSIFLSALSGNIEILGKQNVLLPLEG